MKPSLFKRIMAMSGVLLLVGLFIAAIISLLLGNLPLAVTFIAVNGFITIVLYFALRFHKNAVEANSEITGQKDND